jgi:DNA-binding beta-propeller fold protein YncE
MTARSMLSALILSALLAACGGSGSHRRTPPHAVTVASSKPTAGLALADHRPLPPERAFVTAETENRLLVVAIPSGRVVRRIALPPDPEDLATAGDGGPIVVVSAAAGKVTLIGGDSLQPLKTLGGFDHPHIAAVAPDRRYAYVTDDAPGTLTAIDLTRLRVTSTIHVGTGAHHLSFDLKDRWAWVALGESARAFVLVSTSDFGHPREAGRFSTGSPIHDVAISPDGTRVWATSAAGRDVTVLDGFDGGVRFRVPVGAPPQHVALAGRYAYLTSGYGGVVEQVDARTGHVVTRARSPYGSFELAADGRYVVTSSLLRGTLAIYTPELKLLRVVHLAPATREVALSSPAGIRP